eukprot:3898276-Rhodomonas_salina.2
MLNVRSLHFGHVLYPATSRHRAGRVPRRMGALSQAASMRAESSREVNSTKAWCFLAISSTRCTSPYWCRALCQHRALCRTLMHRDTWLESVRRSISLHSSGRFLRGGGCYPGMVRTSHTTRVANDTPDVKHARRRQRLLLLLRSRSRRERFLHRVGEERDVSRGRTSSGAAEELRASGLEREGSDFSGFGC